jgi:hypothetical protein
VFGKITLLKSSKQLKSARKKAVRAVVQTAFVTVVVVGKTAVASGDKGQQALDAVALHAMLQSD